MAVDRGKSGSSNVKSGRNGVWIKFEYMLGSREVRAFPSGDLYFLWKVAGKIICEREGVSGRGVVELC